VRSEVRVFPGPPLLRRLKRRRRRPPPWLTRKSARRPVGLVRSLRLRATGFELHVPSHSPAASGAIAQLGERVLCKHEVVGSIPSGSTSGSWRSMGRCPIRHSRLRHSPFGPHPKRNRASRRRLRTAIRVMFDIVKREHVRTFRPAMGGMASQRSAPDRRRAGHV
jgi:hypothetical protein